MDMFVNSSLQFGDCITPETRSIMVSLLVTSVLRVPLFVPVLVIGYQQWRKKPSGSRSSTSNHLDIFTYNVVVLDLLGVLGTCFYCSGTFTRQRDLTAVGKFLFIIISPGQTLFHLLACVERYLAVVHPVAYLALKQASGVRIRNITVGCAWLISLIVMFSATWFKVSFTSVNAFILVFTFITFCFCSLAVLCVLIRPGPGEGGRSGGRADQTKKRALHIIMVITGVLLFNFLVNLITNIILKFHKPFGYMFCLLGLSSLWFSLPSSLVLPLLFLQRVGKYQTVTCSSGGGA